MDSDTRDTLAYAEYWIGFHMWRMHHCEDHGAEEALGKVHAAIVSAMNDLGVSAVTAEAGAAFLRARHPHLDITDRERKK